MKYSFLWDLLVQPKTPEIHNSSLRCWDSCISKFEVHSEKYHLFSWWKWNSDRTLGSRILYMWNNLMKSLPWRDGGRTSETTTRIWGHRKIVTISVMLGLVFYAPRCICGTMSLDLSPINLGLYTFYSGSY